MKKLKYIVLVIIALFSLASCGNNKASMIKKCVSQANNKIPEASFDASNKENKFYSRTEEEKNKTQAAFGFAFLPKNVEYYIIVKGKNKVKDTFLGGMKLARYECAFDKSGKLITNENLK